MKIIDLFTTARSFSLLVLFVSVVCLVVAMAALPYIPLVSVILIACTIGAYFLVYKPTMKWFYSSEGILHGMDSVNTEELTGVLPGNYFE